MCKVSVHFMENKLAIIKNSFREMLYTELRHKQLGFMLCSSKMLRVNLELFGTWTLIGGLSGGLGSSANPYYFCTLVTQVV